MKIAKRGTSLAVRLPVGMAAAMRLKGDEVDVYIAGSREFGIAPKPSLKDLLSRLRAYRGRPPRDFKFNREEANAR